MNTRERVRAFLVDLRALCEKHNACLSPRGDFDYQGGCELILHGCPSGAIEFRGAAVDEASAWLETDETPITVTE